MAERIDQSAPSGASWRREPLPQMAVELPDVRPAVIFADLIDKLDRYRGFRHVVRNVYAHVLGARRVGELVVRHPAGAAFLRAPQ